MRRDAHVGAVFVLIRIARSLYVGAGYKTAVLENQRFSTASCGVGKPGCIFFVGGERRQRDWRKLFKERRYGFSGII